MEIKHETTHQPQWQPVTDWEKKHGKPYPDWALVWHYDIHDECWGTRAWWAVKDFYVVERQKNVEKNAFLNMHFEPMVALPTDDQPSWGECVLLKRIPKTKEGKS